FEAANRAFYGGELDKAIAGYERLVNAGIDDSAVDYNLGTAFAQTGRYGRAILHFERALRIDGSDSEAVQSLLKVHAILSRREAQRVGEAMTTNHPHIGEALVRPSGEASIAWLVLALDIVFFGMMGALRLSRAQSVLRVPMGATAAVVG